ncbi:MAG: hypothetical protein PHP08_00390 [Candidatus Dojkabacteria bacterium]|nr:hypothetical protein [Candidatus Dojkabacteria bacterium]
MPDTKTTAIIAAAAVVGGMYLASMRAGSKMCADTAAFNTKMASFQATCPSPSTYELMKYFVI